MIAPEAVVCICSMEEFRKNLQENEILKNTFCTDHIRPTAY